MRLFKTFILATALGFAGTAGLVATAPPAHAELPAEAFGKLPSVHDAAISPDGRKIAVYVNIGGGYGVQVVDLDNPGGKPRGVRLPEDAKPSWIRWANNDRVLMDVWQSQRLRGVPFNIGSIYTLDTKEMDGKWLVRPKRKKGIGSNVGTSDGDVFEQFYNDVVDFLPDDPDHILMTFMDRVQFKRDVHKVNVETGRYETIERGSTSIQSWTTDMTGTPRVKEGLNRSADSADDYNMWIKSTDGKWIDVSEFSGIDPQTPVYGFTSDPNEMIVGLRRGKDTRGLYIYDLSTRSVGRKLFHNDTYDVSNIVVDPEAGEVIGATYVGDTSETELFPGYDTAMAALRRKYDGYSVHYVDSNDGGDTILYKVSNGYEPGTLLLQRKGESEPIRIMDYRPGLPSAEMGLVVPVRYKARDGQRIPSYVTLPPTVSDTSGIDKLPFIVLPHGGPFARDSAEFDWFAQFFASRGYGVLQMNFRGSTGYGESFAKAGRESWQVMRDDVTDGAKWLVEKGYADPDRMCVAGWSYGGYAALMNGVDHPELFSCVVSIAGLSDLEGAINQAKEFRFGKLQREAIMKGFKDKADMKANNPVRVASGMTLPTFIAHGEYDTQVQIDQHRKLKRVLKKAGVDLTEMEFDEEDHYMSNQDNRTAMMKKLDAFLTKVNGRSEFIKE